MRGDKRYGIFDEVWSRSTVKSNVIRSISGTRLDLYGNWGTAIDADAEIGSTGEIYRQDGTGYQRGGLQGTIKVAYEVNNGSVCIRRTSLDGNRVVRASDDDLECGITC